jgi:hypothetical protein
LVRRARVCGRACERRCVGVSVLGPLCARARARVRARWGLCERLWYPPRNVRFP